MSEASENTVQFSSPQKPVEDILFEYLRSIIYKPSSAFLDIDCLPETFREFGKGLLYIGSNLGEMMVFANELAAGNLNGSLPASGNEMASSLKKLHSSLKHLTWQTQQVAKGDYNQRVNFMGDFSVAFNNMIEQLEHRQKIILDEKTKLEMYVDLILVNCPNPILLFDSLGKLIYVSDSYFEYCKILTKDEILGKEINELFAPMIPPQSLKDLVNLYNSAIAEERMFGTEQTMNFGDPGTPGHFKIQITPMLDSDKKAIGIIMFLTDMTESIQARREAENARELAEQSSHAKSNFLAMMSHEIRTPMNAILGMTELALREEISPAVKEQLITIKQAGTNLLAIINDVLDFSKIEVGKLEIIPVKYLFTTLVYDVIHIIKTRIIDSPLRFVVFIDSNLPESLFGDAIRIRQVLLNLLSNAGKYTEKGFISLSVRGDMTGEDTLNLIIEIQDSGQGIKPEEMGKIFDKFTRIDTEKNARIEGTGLGLAICRNLIEAMGGQIYAQSEYNKGSTFTVILPQKLCGNNKLAVIENPEDKNILIYERRDIYAESINRTMENLGVRYKLVSNTKDFLSGIESKKYTYVFLASALYDEFKTEFSSLASKAKFAVITEFGEVITDHNVSTLTMPVFCIPVASFLNGISDSHYYIQEKKTIAGFTAPEAKVLVVDDINTNLTVIEGLLAPYKMHVDLCKSGMDAIKEVKSTFYDLVLLDNMMPEMDGIETLSRIRALDEGESGAGAYFGELPIVALTANAVLGARDLFLEHGFNDFISKPIDTIKLNEILEKWIPKEKQIKKTAEKFHSVAVNRYEEDEKIIIDGLDSAKGLAMAGGNLRNYLKILSAFYDDGLIRIRETGNNLKTGDITLYVTHVHALKSASAYIGADELSKAALALEEAGRKKDMDFIESHNSAFIAALEKLLDNINNYVSERTKEEHKNSIDNGLLKMILSELKTALDAFDSEKIKKAVSILEEFIPQDGNGIIIKNILNCVLTGGYEEAIASIETLLREIK